MAEKPLFEENSRSLWSCAKKGLSRRMRRIGHVRTKIRQILFVKIGGTAIFSPYYLLIIGFFIAVFSIYKYHCPIE